MILYPSLGVKSYEYSSDEYKDDMAFMLALPKVAEWYHNVCRNFRNVWNWSPSECDNIYLSRVVQIYKELKEDNKE